ncbi:MAG: hypothetical protein HY720_08780 [Planctomycetes bacterium]|nr:hypothetical protein [Planctomycetota bacterium]
MRNEGTTRALLLLALFAATRIAVWFLSPEEGEVEAVFAPYALACRRAHAEGVSVYEWHDREIARMRTEALAAGRPPPPEEYRSVEYPPLAIALLWLPGLLVEDSGGEEGRREFLRSYSRAFRILMLAADLALLALVWRLARRLFPGESARECQERVLLYVAGSLALGPFLYDRIDLPLAALAILSLALLVSRARWIWSFAALAVAIHVKIVPIALAPAWIVGAWPVFFKYVERPRRVAPTLRAFASRAGALAFLLALLLAPFLFLWGTRSLDFYAFHRDRGLEIESVYATVLMALSWFGHAIEVRHGHGSYNLWSPAADGLARASGGIVAALLVAGSALLVLAVRRRARAAGSPVSPGAAPSPARLAQAFPAEFALAALFLFTASVAGNKVLSPQFLLWILPFACLAPFPRRARLAAWGILLAALVLTPVVFPLLFWDHLVAGPTVLGATVLGIRNVFLVAFLCGLCVALIRRARS